MAIQLVNIGFGNIAVADRIIAIVNPESAPVKRAVKEAREASKLIDATCGRRTRAVIMTDAGIVIQAAVLPETIARRMTVTAANDEGEGE